MNNDQENLKRMLEEVTAPGSAPAGNDDPETASLRKTWLAFGKLLDAADEAAPALVVPQLPMPTDAVPRPANDKAPGKRWALIAAAAAAVLALVSIGWRMAQTGTVPDSNPSVAKVPGAGTGNQLVTKSEIVKPENTIAQNLPAVTQHSSGGASTGSSSNKDTSWEDPLETEVASLSGQITRTEQTWRHRTDEVDVVQYQLDEAQNSLQNDSL